MHLAPRLLIPALLALLTLVGCPSTEEVCELTDCDGECIDTSSDRDNCGSCGTVCGAGEVCDGSGACTLSCQEGLLDCGGTCVDPMTDEAFCGASANCEGINAGVACEAGELCDGAGECALSCQVGLLECGGTCVDPNTDRNFCGATGDCLGPNVGSSCGPGEICNGSGECVLSCPEDLLQCGDTCVDPLTDEAFCGATGDCEGPNAGTPCGPGEFCDGLGSCALTCPAGLIECGGTCVDPNTDEAFCGASGDCLAPNAGTICDAGEVCDGTGSCALSCQTGLIDCGGTCVDPDTDEAFCGATGDCLAPNAGTACAAGEVCDGTGSCALSCQVGLIDCGGTCVDPNTDEAFCGASGNCAAANAGTICAAGEVCDGTGSCAVSCQAGLIECGGTCIDPLSSPTYCGAQAGCTASTTCTANEACVGGSCTLLITPTSCLEVLQFGFGTTDGVYSIQPAGAAQPFDVYCDLTEDAGGWTLIARFANSDAANWMLDTGEWWYTRTAAAGADTDRGTSADMYNPAFHSVLGSEIRISRTDNPTDIGLLVTTGGCLPVTDFRSFITSFGNFQNGAVWGNNSVAGTCPATFGSNFATTSGFSQATCTGDIGAPNSISFWSDWSAGDGAVMMIGGGGNGCSRADHGIGVTEANNASFVFSPSNAESDFGDDGFNQNAPYSLNLWVR